MDRCCRDMFRRRPSDGSWKNDRLLSDWPSPACPPDHREWREVYLTGMTSFSSERLADNPLCTLSARKMSVEGLGPQVNHLRFRRFRARSAIWQLCEVINLPKVPILCDDER